MSKPCPFCTIKQAKVVDENALAYAIEDLYPVTKGHTLLIPKRHEADYFKLYQDEKCCLDELLCRVQQRLRAEDASIQGFNVGINIGEEAGQTVFHCHIHLIPRRKHDVPNPRGGVRHVIAHKGDYPTPVLEPQ